ASGCARASKALRAEWSATALAAIARAAASNGIVPKGKRVGGASAPAIPSTSRAATTAVSTRNSPDAHLSLPHEHADEASRHAGGGSGTTRTLTVREHEGTRRERKRMAVPKIVGIETEYGVQLRGAADPNPVLASSLLINGYVEQRRVGWDFEDESPGRDARGFARDGAQPPEVETHLVNAVLTNGARYYVDHAHPEYSTPECSDAIEAVLFDRAGERILARSMDAARRLLPPGQEIVVYKNNSDGKGNSYGCHENYLVDRNVPFALLVRNLIPWFVTRQIFTGAGKVGAENGAD